MPYDGYLRPLKADIIKLYRKGYTCSEIAGMLDPRTARLLYKRRWPQYDFTPPQAATINFILLREGVFNPFNTRFDAVYKLAREDHAALLRLEGLTYEEIGRRLGVDKRRANSILIDAQVRWNKIVGRAKFRIEFPFDRLQFYDACGHM